MLPAQELPDPYLGFSLWNHESGVCEGNRNRSCYRLFVSSYASDHSDTVISSDLVGTIRTGIRIIISGNSYQLNVLILGNIIRKGKPVVVFFQLLAGFIGILLGGKAGMEPESSEK